MFRVSCFVKNLEGHVVLAKRLALRPAGPVTHFTSPRDEKCRLGLLEWASVIPSGEIDANFAAQVSTVAQAGAPAEHPKGL